MHADGFFDGKTSAGDRQKQLLEFLTKSNAPGAGADPGGVSGMNTTQGGAETMPGKEEVRGAELK